MGKEKQYVIDTNVLLEDPDAIFKLRNGHENSVHIPYHVLLELNKLKKDPRLGIIATSVIRNLSQHQDQYEIIKAGAVATSSSDGSVLVEHPVVAGGRVPGICRSSPGDRAVGCRHGVVVTPADRRVLGVCCIVLPTANGGSGPASAVLQAAADGAIGAADDIARTAADGRNRRICCVAAATAHGGIIPVGRVA